MEEGPFRVSRPADRRGVVRPEQAQQRQPEQVQPTRVEPQPADRPPTSHKAKEKKASKRGKLPLVAGIIVAILLAAVLVFWFGTRSAGTAIDTSKYQAVFLTNGEEYFGKLESMNDNYMKLTDIYYLQTQSGAESESENTQNASSDQSNVQLIKLGEEIHGPEDEMIISKEQIVFYENLNPEGKVSQSIEQFKQAD